MSDTIITDTAKFKELFNLMQTYGIESFKAGDIEIARESLKLKQAENELSMNWKKLNKHSQGAHNGRPLLMVESP